MKSRVNARPSSRASAWFAAALLVGAPPAVTAQEPSRPQEPSRAQEQSGARTGPRVLFSAPLEDMPGMNLTVVELAAGPNPEPPSTPDRHGRGHRHPGSVLVYVTQGAMRMAIEGGPVQVVEAGETFFEPPRAHHIIGENASATEPSRAIAVMIVPDGEPLTVPEPE